MIVANETERAQHERVEVGAPAEKRRHLLLHQLPLAEQTERVGEGRQRREARPVPARVPAVVHEQAGGELLGLVAVAAVVGEAQAKRVDDVPISRSESVGLGLEPGRVPVLAQIRVRSSASRATGGTG
jgi:hypothetical protein